MRLFFLIVLLVVLGAVAYGYTHNPTAFAQLEGELQADWPGIQSDVTTIFTSTTPDAASPSDQTPTTLSAPTASSAWTAPATFPSQPNWTWTTSEGTYTNVHIIKVEPDCVTILHTDGQALVPIYELPPEVQTQLNYNPAEAIKFAAQRKANAQSSAPTVASQTPQASPTPALPQPSANALKMDTRPKPFFTETTNYSDGLAEAKRTQRKVLLHFTGSDWCGYCKLLDQEVLSRGEWSRFADQSFIMVTLDFPHDTPIADDLKKQNDDLAHKYGVTGFPTLIVIDTNEKELGRSTGYNPGSGPSAVIGDLKAYAQ